MRESGQGEKCLSQDTENDNDNTIRKIINNHIKHINVIYTRKKNKTNKKKKHKNTNKRRKKNKDKKKRKK